MLLPAVLLSVHVAVSRVKEAVGARVRAARVRAGQRAALLTPYLQKSKLQTEDHDGYYFYFIYLIDLSSSHIHHSPKMRLIRDGDREFHNNTDEDAFQKETLCQRYGFLSTGLLPPPTNNSLTPVLIMSERKRNKWNPRGEV